MKIIVVGCGKIGKTIVASLVKEGHDVVALDNNPDVISDITNVYDAIGVCGNGADCETLSEAGVEHCELFVSFTNSDELNMLACYIAKSMGAKHTIARIRNPEYNDRSLSFMRQKLGLSMSVNPELLAAQELFNILKLPSAAKIETFSRRNFEIVELILREDSKFDGMKLVDLRKKYTQKFLICMVGRGDEVYIPDGNFELKSGDRIGIIATTSEVQKLLKSLGILQKQARDIMILGASKTAYYLSKMLLSSGNNVKVVELNKERCAHFAEVLPSAVTIHGDGANQELLLEEGICSMDAFVSLTGMDEENVLVSYFAASKNVPTVITKINRNEFKQTAEKLGLTTVISPRSIVSDVLVRYARALQNSIGSSMETLYKLMDDKAEAIEFVVSADSKITGIALKDLKTRENTLVCGIIRGRKIIIPDGEDIIEAGDHVVVISTGHRINNISDILK